MFYANEPYGDLETARSRREAQAENEARLAKAYAFWTTQGAGEYLAPQPFKFDVGFVEMPCFSYGYSVVTDEEDQQLITGYYPRAHAGVRDWVREVPPGNQDDIDPSLVPYYTGAYVFFVIDIMGALGVDGTTAFPNYTIIHHMKWEGLALKNLPAYLLDF